MNIERIKDHCMASAYGVAGLVSTGIFCAIVVKNIDIIAKGVFSQISKTDFVPLLILNVIGMATCLLLAKRIASIFLGRAMAIFDNGRSAPFPEWANFSQIVLLRLNHCQ
ncbi:Conserved hypothetical membrane protein [Candidatus Protochlamydia naegleriophila]|uniref:Conserved hypothetical membrane protein n=1 Tax=Candidatus Protochlamydia naegleriophila TaxID=389348 RepID=A0A0U5EP59_9BACT|nr:hypothetical protein [Candidatus Protochlamydia naegleriophila]CUI15728.1 Conserved hypothetical membrane protein [Candidatus Protochlamydia naegleriophila]